MAMDNKEEINDMENVKEDEKLNSEDVECNEKDKEENVDEAEETDAESTETKKEDTKDPLEEANSQIEEFKDKYLRSVAEFDNYRKRTLKEKTELILNGSEKTISAVLPILDDMERALANADKTDDPKVLKEGMDLIYQKFGKILEGLGLKKIETEDKDFNTDYHEAIAMVPGMGDEKKGKVLDCVQIS